MKIVIQAEVEVNKKFVEMIEKNNNNKAMLCMAVNNKINIVGLTNVKIRKLVQEKKK